MKFTPREDIKARGGRLFEGPDADGNSNTYDSEKQGLDDATIERWYQHGWIEVSGWDPAPARQVRGIVVQPTKARHQQEETPHG